MESLEFWNENMLHHHHEHHLSRAKAVGIGRHHQIRRESGSPTSWFRDWCSHPRDLPTGSSRIAVSDVHTTLGAVSWDSWGARTARTAGEAQTVRTARDSSDSLLVGGERSVPAGVDPLRPSIDANPRYMSIKIRKFRTDKFDTRDRQKF